jgi:hypothetical protein
MRLLLVSIALFLPFTAHANSLSFSVGGAGLAVTHHDQRLATGTLDVGFGIDARGPTAGLHYRATVGANLLGNLVWELRGGHDLAGTRFAAGLRGVLGPLALRAQLAWGNRERADPWPLMGSPNPPMPRAPSERSWGLDGELQATWRINRSWSLLIRPELEHRSGTWSGSLATTLRRSSIGPDFDASLHAVLQPTDAPSRGLVGVSLHHVPRRAPSSEAGVWFAANSWGAHGRLAWRASGWLWHLQGAVGAAPAGIPSDFVSAAVELPALNGTLHFGGGWGAQGGLAQLSLRVPLGR